MHPNIIRGKLESTRKPKAQPAMNPHPSLCSDRSLDALALALLS